MRAITKEKEEAISRIIGRALIDYSATHKAFDVIEAATEEILSLLSITVHPGGSK